MSTPTMYIIRSREFVLEEGEYEKPYKGYFVGKYASLEEALSVKKKLEIDKLKNHVEFHWMMPFNEPAGCIAQSDRGLESSSKRDEAGYKDKLVKAFQDKHGLAINWNSFKWDRMYYKSIGLPDAKVMPDEYLETIHEVFEVNYFDIIPWYEDSKLYSISRKPNKLFKKNMPIGGAPYWGLDKYHPRILHSEEEAMQDLEDFINTDVGNYNLSKILKKPWQELYEIVEYPMNSALKHSLQEFLL